MIARFIGLLLSRAPEYLHEPRTKCAAWAQGEIQAKIRSI
jgi:hypothetical protein